MAALTGRRIGFVGLGLMGKPMARNIHKAGAEVRISSRSRGPVDELAAEGLIPMDSPGAVAAASEIVVVCVTDTPSMEDVALRADGIFSGFHPGLAVVDMGTSEVGATRRLAAEAEARGGDWVDAPVSGGQVGAIEGTLTIMAGGRDAAFARVLPVLDAMGRRITHVGGSGAGQVAKAANQMIVAITIGAVAEAFAFARAAGVDPARVRDAIRGGFAESRILELHGERMVTGAFAPGGRARVQLKDLRQAVDLKDEMGVDLPILDLLRERFADLVEQGDGDLDHSALYRLYVRD